ncbi:MAG: hypothetical protein A3G52_04385 [Candidatus Taylorbacteria bacterium RIFCSPLOWO2_12_FULL_43_20]|uniref:VWFA domain-containing protein n=1 Tax=Candidatus Taylorbacteria bacterium RIFCSPLOWO2_12_FULL_43_20 TaxID=1802332 RepID=A0A1G2P006_9BACT|nr:MAG: hypothetical protein A3H58_03410 [Candidatus Taylorbacteria bacterium RIFCSPLOWO2_02_FULL_43_22b]OHA41674.1 MAG: hypothetical protein A3G52_04385 [Candidatus Taylorbacteria bacterium RIFCSPLOWO2_12_FULL_43_20]
MSHWATKRKLSYIGAFFVLLFVGFALPVFFFVYDSPTCFDGKQNQNETGIDCGGSCNILCSTESIRPLVLWQRIFKVLPGIYNAVAYVENANISSGSEAVPYVFELYDENGSLIAERKGVADIPPNKKFPIFEDRIDTGGKTPSRTIFQFTDDPVWKKDTRQFPDIRVTSSSLVEGEDNPRVLSTIENRSLEDIYDLEVVAMVYDSGENVIAASRTYVNKLEKGGSENLVFTWPYALDLGVVECESPADVMLVIDRSGSMDDDGGDPPEPLSSVKKAAVSFVENMKERDRAGVVSFANTASDPLDIVLTADFKKVKDSVFAINIATTSGPQNTNIGSGLIVATKELLSERGREEAKKVIVLLTDGLPSRPTLPDNKEYPEKYAIDAANGARAANIDLYAIGLGSGVRADFLRDLTVIPDRYFEAARPEELIQIYRNIAASICKLGPTKIQISPILK